MMTDAQFALAYARYRRVIAALARKLARRDDDLAADLEQVGLIGLWRLDVSRATTNEDAWVRQALVNRMRSHIRSQHPERYVSLTALVDDGVQLVETASGPQLVKRDEEPDE